MTRSLVAVASAALLLGCAPASEPTTDPVVDTAADIAAINALADREVQVFSDADTAAFATVFSPDVLTMPPNDAALDGLEALTAWTEAMAEQYTFSAVYHSSDVIVSGDLAVQTMTGTLTMTPKAGGETIAEDVKAIHVLRRQADGTWRITQDIWNSNAPPPAGGN